MDINLPLILFVLVAVTGLGWLFDLIFLKKDRMLAIAAVDQQFESLTEEQKEKDEKYQNALSVVVKEPVIVEYSKSFFPVLMLVFVLRSFIIEPFQIPSESMVPTLEVGDFIVVNKFAYGIRLPIIRTKIIDLAEPKRGDVMVFFPPHEDRYFIKRVVGLPGDKIRYTDNVLYINGEKIEQELVGRDPAIKPTEHCYGSYYIVVDETIGDKTHKMRKCAQPGRYSTNGYWEVPEGHYMMMGDNRDNSLEMWSYSVKKLKYC